MGGVSGLIMTWVHELNSHDNESTYNPLLLNCGEIDNVCQNGLSLLHPATCGDTYFKPGYPCELRYLGCCCCALANHLRF
jgi:hypothetical protein